MAIARQSLTVGADQTESGTTMTTAVTISSGSNLLLVVTIHLEGNFTGEDSVSTVVWNGTSLTELDKTWHGSWSETQMWYLKAPTPATGNLVTTVNNTLRFPGKHAAWVFTGVDQTTTFRTTQKTAQGGSHSGTSSSLTVPSVVSGDYLLDAITVDGTGHSLVAGANQTEEYDDPTGGTDNGGSSQQGADGGVMSWSWTTSADYSHIATALIADGGGGGVTVKRLSALGVG